MPIRVQDIVPSDRRSIRDLSVQENEATTSSARGARRSTGGDVRKPAPAASRSKSALKSEDDGSKEKPVEIAIHRIPEQKHNLGLTPPAIHHRAHKRRGKRWLFITLAVLAVVIVAAYFGSISFSRATFTITPKIIPITINNTLVVPSTSATATLAYTLVTIHGTASSTVTATNGPETRTKATGKVNLYNSYSSQAVRLIAGTRLADASGRVYRLTSSIIIPGYTKPSGSIIPGFTSANIVADQPGQSYNISRTDSISDLKIIAYKGTTKYDSEYARLITDVTGGFVGVKKIVDPAVITSTASTLTNNLTKSLLAQAKAAVPAGYILYDNAYASSFGSPTVDSTSASANDASITEQGTVYGILLPMKGLISALANVQAARFDNFDYTTPGLESLKVTVTNAKDFSPERKSPVILHFAGAVKLVGTIPVDDIKAKLSGMPLSATERVFKTYSPVIESGSGELLPPWAKIPADLSRIKVVVQGE